MCGKFNVLSDDGTTADVFPGGSARTIVEADGGFRTERAVWGFPSNKGGLLFNARAETAPSAPTFAESFFLRRAAIPARGFYEWSPRAENGKKQEYFFRADPGSALYLAGFYRGTAAKRFVVLTTAATYSAEIHPRFPLVLTDKNMRDYLADVDFAFSFLETRPIALRAEAVPQPTDLLYP